MSYSDTIPLHPSSQSDIDEIENLINSNPSPVVPVQPPSPPRASIPVSSAPPPPPAFVPSNLPPPTAPKPTPVTSITPTVPAVPAAPSPPPVGSAGSIAGSGFGSSPNTLTEPVWDTVKRDLSRIVSNLRLVVFPNPFREEPGKALRDWDLWGPFFFIVFLGLVLSWSASVKKVSWSSSLREDLWRGVEEERGGSGDFDLHSSEPAAAAELDTEIRQSEVRASRSQPSPDLGTSAQ